MDLSRYNPTARLARALRVGVDEARARGHTFLGTEHVLLGLLAERNAIAAKVLEELGVLDAVRDRLEAIMGGPDYGVPSVGFSGASSQPDTETASQPYGSQPIRLRPPEELVRIGFQRSSIVIVNECHNGSYRSRRTREVGRRILPAAHDAGVRWLAMEALTSAIAEEADVTRRLPPVSDGYLGQPDLRDLISDALALGWNLYAYECEFELRPGQTADTFQTLEFANWRDEEEARNIARFLAGTRSETKLLVWCGHSHQRKTPQPYHSGGTWIRFGQRVREITGIDPFVIDQSVTVEYRRGSSPRVADVDHFRDALQGLGGTAGFLREEDPAARWRNDLSADAFVLSLHNSMD
jgi:hypothetical protein